MYVKNAKLLATASEGIVIEGKNKVTLENVELEAKFVAKKIQELIKENY